MSPVLVRILERNKINAVLEQQLSTGGMVSTGSMVSVGGVVVFGGWLVVDPKRSHL